MRSKSRESNYAAAKSTCTVLGVIYFVVYHNGRVKIGIGELQDTVLDYKPGSVKLSGQHEEMRVVRGNGQVERIGTVDLGFFLGIAPDISKSINHAEVQRFPGDGGVLYRNGITEVENGVKEYIV